MQGRWPARAALGAGRCIAAHRWRACSECVQRAACSLPGQPDLAAPPHTPSPLPAGQLAFHTRTLDDNVIKALFVPEEEYGAAQGGEWVLKHRCGTPPPPGQHAAAPVALHGPACQSSCGVLPGACLFPSSTMGNLLTSCLPCLARPLQRRGWHPAARAVQHHPAGQRHHRAVGAQPQPRDAGGIQPGWGPGSDGRLHSQCPWGAARSSPWRVLPGLYSVLPPAPKLCVPPASTQGRGHARAGSVPATGHHPRRLPATPAGIATMLASSINEEEVPFEEGWVKLRGFTPTVTKQQIIDFLKVVPPVGPSPQCPLRLPVRQLTGSRQAAEACAPLWAGVHACCVVSRLLGRMLGCPAASLASHARPCTAMQEDHCQGTRHRTHPRLPRLRLLPAAHCSVCPAGLRPPARSPPPPSWVSRTSSWCSAPTERRWARPLCTCVAAVPSCGWRCRWTAPSCRWAGWWAHGGGRG